MIRFQFENLSYIFLLLLYYMNIYTPGSQDSANLEPSEYSRSYNSTPSTVRTTPKRCPRGSRRVEGVCVRTSAIARSKVARKR
jgi:hypothetical protein